MAFGLNVAIRRPADLPLIHSERLMHEVEGFVRVGYAQYEAAAGYKDDLMMAMLITWVTSNDEDFSKFIDHEQGIQEATEEKFYEPGKAPTRIDADPALTDADAEDTRDVHFAGISQHGSRWVVSNHGPVSEGNLPTVRHGDRPG